MIFLFSVCWGLFLSFTSWDWTSFTLSEFWCDTRSWKQWRDLSYCWVATWEAYNLGNFKLDFVCRLQLLICIFRITNWLAVWWYVFINSGMRVKEINTCVDATVSTTDRFMCQEGMVFFSLWGFLVNTDSAPGKWQSLIWKWGKDDLRALLVMIPVCSEVAAEPPSLWTLGPVPPAPVLPLPPSHSLGLSLWLCFPDSRGDWRGAGPGPVSQPGWRAVSLGEGAGWAEGREWEPDRHAVQQRGGAEQDQGHHERHPRGAGPASEEGERAKARVPGAFPPPCAAERGSGTQSQGQPKEVCGICSLGDCHPFLVMKSFLKESSLKMLMCASKILKNTLLWNRQSNWMVKLYQCGDFSHHSPGYARLPQAQLKCPSFKIG